MIKYLFFIPVLSVFFYINVTNKDSIKINTDSIKLDSYIKKTIKVLKKKHLIAH